MKVTSVSAKQNFGMALSKDLEKIAQYHRSRLKPSSVAHFDKLIKEINEKSNRKIISIDVVDKSDVRSPIAIRMKDKPSALWGDTFLEEDTIGVHNYKGQNGSIFQGIARALGVDKNITDVKLDYNL